MQDLIAPAIERVIRKWTHRPTTSPFVARIRALALLPASSAWAFPGGTGQRRSPLNDWLSARMVPWRG
jgi:hypothetical protein